MKFGNENILVSNINEKLKLQLTFISIRYKYGNLFQKFVSNKNFDVPPLSSQSPREFHSGVSLSSSSSLKHPSCNSCSGASSELCTTSHQNFEWHLRLAPMFITLSSFPSSLFSSLSLTRAFSDLQSFEQHLRQVRRQVLVSGL